MAGIGDYKKGGKFTLKSGNSPLAFKEMGSSPARKMDITVGGLPVEGSSGSDKKKSTTQAHIIAKNQEVINNAIEKANERDALDYLKNSGDKWDVKEHEKILRKPVEGLGEWKKEEYTGEDQDIRYPEDK